MGEGRVKNNNPVDVLLSAPARFTAGEECELQRVLRWLETRRDMTGAGILLALEHRDHRQTGQPSDRSATVERRIDILSQLLGDAPLCRSADELATILELEDDELEQLDDDLRALEAAGLICTGLESTAEWRIDIDTDEAAVRAGLAVLAASTVPTADPSPGPWRVNDAEGYVYADAGDDEASRKHVEVGYLGRCVAESIAPGDRALIAAAPELLAACEAMNASLDGHPLKPHALSVLMQMRAAVAKARGQ